MAFTISFWIYIADWSYRFQEPKAIIIKDVASNGAVSGTNCAPGIWLAPNKNNLIVKTRVLGKDKPQICDVANIPIQKWVHIAYVLDNRTVDVYVDCKLERSCILAGVPFLNNNKLHLFPKNQSSNSEYNTDDNKTGFLGQLSSLRYFSHALKPVDIARICNEGPNSTVGEQSNTHKPDDKNAESCPTKISYTAINDVTKVLTKGLHELNTIKEQANDNISNQGTAYSLNFTSVDTPSPNLRKVDNDDITEFPNNDGGINEMFYSQKKN